MEAYYHSPDKYKSLPNKTPSPQKAFVNHNTDNPPFKDHAHPGNIWKRWLFLPNGTRLGQTNQLSTLSTKRIDARRGQPDSKRDYMTLPAVNMTTENTLFGLPTPLPETIRKPIKPLGYSSKIAVQKKQREYYLKEHLTKRDSLNSSPDSDLEEDYRSKEIRHTPGNVLDAEENDPKYTLNSITMEDGLGTGRLTRGASVVSIGTDIEFKQEIMAEKFNHNHGRGFRANKDILVMQDVEANTSREKSRDRKNEDYFSLMKEKEKKEIKEVNEKIKALMHKGLSKNKSASDLKRPNGSPSKLYDKIKSTLNRGAVDRNHIIVLFDEGLEFMVDYISGFDFSVRLLFERLDDYANAIDGFVGESQVNASKRKFNFSYFCVFVFLKVDPTVNQKSLEILKDIMKLNRCYVVKSNFGRSDVNLQIDYGDEKITEEWKKNSEHVLTIKQNRSSQCTVSFEEFQRLQNFVSKKTKSFLDKFKKN